MNGLSIKDIHKTFPTTTPEHSQNRALCGVSFEAPGGQITAVLGPSGCGKSTLLNIVAGLEVPDQGDILWDDVSLKEIPAYQRGFGLMFQDFALFPHMNVFDNVAFGLQMARQSREAIQTRIKEVLELVGLPGFERRDVNRLSGGEQQRVALARALAPRPRLLMLDEPLGALDRLLRERLVNDLRGILRGSTQTALYITHDQEEAFALADRVVVMNAGQIEQIGVPEAIYRQPASLFVAQFLGMSNLLVGNIQRGRVEKGETEWIALTTLGRLPLTNPPADLRPGAATILLRSEAARLGQVSDFRLSGVIRDQSFRGSTCHILFEVLKTNIGSPLNGLHNVTLAFDIACNDTLPAIGETIWLSLETEHAVLVFQ